MFLWVCTGVSSKLPAAPDPALSRDDPGGLLGSRPIPLGGQDTAAAGTPLARSPSGRKPVRTWLGGGHRAVGGQLDRHFRRPDNQRLANHLRHEQPHLFTFLGCPGLHATNNFAERAIRLMAMARKTWGGNRTATGARTQQILASVLRTCWQQGKDAFGQLVKLLRSAQPILLAIVPTEPSP